MNLKYKIPRIFEGADYDKDVNEDLKKLFEKQIRSGKGLYLYGGTGTGKTHTAYAMAKKLSTLPVETLFYNTTLFLDDIREEFSHGIDYDVREESIFKEAMNLRGVLFLDDLGSEKCTEWALERFTVLINHRWEELLPTIFTSNCDLEILSARMGDRVSSRIFSMTERVKIDGVDRRTQDA